MEVIMEEVKLMKIRELIIIEIEYFIYKFDRLLSRLISRSTYKCPICGKESSDSSEINSDLYNHIYNKE